MLIQHTAVLVQRHPHAFSNTWLLNPMDPNNSVSVHLSIYSSPSLYAAHPASTQLTQLLRSSPSLYAAHPASTQLTQPLRSSPGFYSNFNGSTIILFTAHPGTAHPGSPSFFAPPLSVSAQLTCCVRLIHSATAASIPAL